MGPSTGIVWKFDYLCCKYLKLKNARNSRILLVCTASCRYALRPHGHGMYSMPPIPTNLLGTWRSGRLPGTTRRLVNGSCRRRARAFIDLLLDDETHIALSDGVNLRYHAPGAEVPPKYQLLIAFDDDSFLVFTVAMYGGIIAFREALRQSIISAHSRSPLRWTTLDEACFGRLISDAKSNLSARRSWRRNSVFPDSETVFCRISCSSRIFTPSAGWRRWVMQNWGGCIHR